jgi:methylenetetrahydrofolate reductase (NADPH)
VSRLGELLDAGDRLIVTGEAPVIDGGTLADYEAKLAELAPWCDALNATDNTAAHAHASNVAMAIAMQRLGVEPILQVVCRDKNRIAQQADIMGAALHGVENICCLTGDDVTAGDESEARRVFDLDGPQLIRLASSLKEGRYLSGRSVGTPPSLVIGAVENPGTHPLDYRAQRAAKKILAGARFLQLQICYHPDRLEAFVAALHEHGLTERCAILPSVVAVKGAGPLRFMHGSVPGIDVPQHVIDRVADAEDVPEEAYALFREQCEHALSLPGVRGLHLTDFRRDGSMARVCNDLGIKPRSERESNAHDRVVAV